MPLPRAEREIELLTEGWPGEPDDFELAAFAATFRANRPELSAPAMDRIGLRVEGEFVRVDRSASRRFAVRATALRFRRFAPVAAAISALAVGAWLHFRSAPGGTPSAPVQSLPVIHSQPAPPSDGVAPATATKPIVN